MNFSYKFLLTVVIAMFSSTFAQEQNATSSEQPTTEATSTQNEKNSAKEIREEIRELKNLVAEQTKSNHKLRRGFAKASFQNEQNLIEAMKTTLKAARKAMQAVQDNLIEVASPLVKSQYVFKSHDGTDVIPTASIKDRYNFDMEKFKRDNERAVEEYQRNKNSTETKDTTGDEIKENNTSVPTSTPGVKIRVS